MKFFSVALRSIKLIATSIALVLMSSQSAEAQLTNCKDPNVDLDGEVSKIFIDGVWLPKGITPAELSKGRLGAILDTLVSNFEDTFSNPKGQGTSKTFWSNPSAAITSPDVNMPVAIKRCGDRFPTDRFVFSEDELNFLNRHRVVLEIWASRKSGQELIAIGFVLVPAQASHFSLPAVYELQSSDMLKGMAESRGVLALVPLVLGLKALRDKDYPKAVPLLCAANTRLGSALGGLTPPGQIRKLIDITAELEDEAFRGASKVNSSYPLPKPGPNGTFSCRN